MSDGLLVLMWCGVLAGALATCMLARALRIPATYLRDVLHVGAASWVLGWPAWRSPWPPLVLAVAVALVVTLVHPLARRFRTMDALEHSVSGGRERFAGLVLYGWAYALFTGLAFFHDRGPAAAALLALALGDGIGGLVGRRFGRRRFRLPYANEKSYFGSATVAVFAAAGVALGAAWVGAPLDPARVAGAAALGALVEAWSPRSSDNLLMPAAVWAFLVATG